MSLPYIENKKFEKINFSEEILPKGEYENCSFLNCIFYKSDVSNSAFRDCEFESCDFSLATIRNTVFSNIKFKNCKLLGLHFNDCNPFLLSAYFENCTLKLSTFYKLKIKGTWFKNCNIQEVDFTETDLANSIFENCDLQKAIFDDSNLEKVDFRTAYNYSINPELNRIKKAKFSSLGIAGLLDKYSIIIE